MPIANIMKMRKMFYFYISMDSRVKLDCFLNNTVVIAQEILVLSQNGVWTTAPLFGFTKGAFSQSKNLKNDTNSWTSENPIIALMFIVEICNL